MWHFLSDRMLTHRVIDELPALQAWMIPVLPHKVAELVHNEQVDGSKVVAEGLVELLAVAAQVELCRLLFDLALCHVPRRMDCEGQPSGDEGEHVPGTQLLG